MYLFSFTELTEFKTRRIAYFKKNLVDLVELELKHARVRTPLNWTQKKFLNLIIFIKRILFYS